MDIDNFIPIIAILAVFGTPVAIVAILRMQRSRDNAELQKTLRMSIEKGQPLPPEVVETMSRAVPRAKNPIDDIRWGLIWIAISAGIFFTTYLEHGEIVRHASGVAAIPGLIGIVLVVFGVIGLNTKSKS